MKSRFENSDIERARKRVKEIKSFYINLALYCTIIPILIIINLTFTPGFYWFFFSMAGWGLGLLFHGMAAFNYVPFLSKDWEERKLQQFMEEDRKAREKFRNNDNQNL
ncbi:2TM domain-containing protein [Flavobacterium sp. MFBS3-15]|uniref:2TM domain-containing protein n=1 Tax=Flavobacterium sp. MFBS3-15 TaxID=2989816 RepID=UPI0022369A6E|nr:2TM domain-containing protein [Flavobacterium sp. MFBS3-15]MCW4470573.1 2TM domain-containing protein [Flavobacterium sp. MFBS3-15]